ncbi:UNVERIFIED_CONTAM: hypothetical protein GTU68_022933 [Idotea baltica]|nr:hypothetical protein [Idotea baltica]
MKRHNFGGLRATHGVVVFFGHRSHGSTASRIRARSSKVRRWLVTWAMPA